MHLGTGEGYVKVWMLGIACGILAMTDVHDTRTVPLTIRTMHEAFTLLRIDIGDESLARLEVVADPVWLVLILALLEKGLALDGTRRVYRARSMDKAAVDADADVVCGKLEVLVVDLAVAIEMCPRLAVVERDGVLGRVCYRLIQSILALPCRVWRQGVLLRSVWQDGIWSQGYGVWEK